MSPTPYGNTSNSIEDGQPTAQRRIRTNQNHRRLNRALSWFGKFILFSLGLVTFFLCLGMLGTIVGPDFPTVDAISATASANHTEFTLTLSNPNRKRLSYTNITLTPNFLSKVNDVAVMMSLPTVGLPEFDQEGGASRSLRFPVTQGGMEILNKFPALPSEVKIEFRAWVRYRGQSWLVKVESDMKAKCKRFKFVELGQRSTGISKIENPNCPVTGFWQTARIVVLSSTLLFPILVLVFLHFSSISPQD